MDDNISQHIQQEVARAVNQSQNSLLGEMKELLDSKLGNFETKINETQKDLAKEQMIHMDGIAGAYKFQKKSCEEQFTFNNKVMTKLSRASASISRASSPEELNRAQINVQEGMELITQRQKLIKIADSSEHGWKVVEEYISNPLADDSDDEKKIFRAMSRASRKVKSLRNKKRNETRYKPYKTPESTASISSQSAQYTPKPKTGRCFACGVAGHYRSECLAVRNDSANKISIHSFLHKGSNSANVQQSNIAVSNGFVTVSHSTTKQVEDRAESTLFLNESVSVKPLHPNSPVGRLKRQLNEWKEITDNEHVIDIIEYGYKLPFKSLPPHEILKNNKSAMENVSFVKNELQKLLEYGCIVELDKRPHIVNPLTVATNKHGKQRLVLDCRSINLHLFKFKFKYEDASIARQMFGVGDFLFKFDLKSAYHHIPVHPDDFKYLGFAWHDGLHARYYAFCVLPFGVSTSGYIFTKVLREVIKSWRNDSCRIIMFLDDGLGGDVSESKASDLGKRVTTDLERFGFILTHEKCEWEPKQKIIWLGLQWNTLEGRITLTKSRVETLNNSINKLLKILNSKNKIVKARTLASIAGQIISAQIVFGDKVRLFTRAMYNCLNYKASWDSPVLVNQYAIDEMHFWRENSESINSVGVGIDKASSVRQSEFYAWSDASASGYGGFIRRADPVSGNEYCTPDHGDRTLHENSASDRLAHIGSWAPGEHVSVGVATQDRDRNFGSWAPRRDSDVNCFKGDYRFTELGFDDNDAIQADRVCFGHWERDEECLSSTWRELVAVHRVLKDFDNSADITGLNLTRRIVEEAGKADTTCTPEIDQLMQSMVKHLLESKSTSTVKTYFNNFKKWQDFALHRNFSCLPAQPIHIALYLTHLLDSGSSYHIISSAKYAIKWSHELSNYSDPTNNSFISNLQEAAKRTAFKPVTGKDPVSSDMLIKLCDIFKDSKDFFDIRDLTMLLLGYSGFLRFNELASLRRKDIVMHDSYFTVHIEKSKTDKYRQGDEVVIAKGSSSACPYNMCNRYFNLIDKDDGDESQYIFRAGYRTKSDMGLRRSNKMLSYTTVRERLVNKLRLVGGNLNLGLHSLRSGGATTAANTDVNERCWKRHGRWSTDNSKDRYVVDDLSKRLGVSRKLGL